MLYIEVLTLCLYNHCSLLFAESCLRALLWFTHVMTDFHTVYAYNVAWLCGDEPQSFSFFSEMV